MKANDKLETKWLKAGEALGAGTKIFGFRVDHVHSNAYKMMGSLARNANGDAEIELLEGNDEMEEFQDGDASPEGNVRR